MSLFYYSKIFFLNTKQQSRRKSSKSLFYTSVKLLDLCQATMLVQDAHRARSAQMAPWCFNSKQASFLSCSS